MPRPKNTDDGNNDKKIKELLLSDEPSKRVAGLQLLDATYREEILGYIRFRNNFSSIRFDHIHLGIIWAKTLSTVYFYVEIGKFKYDGSLRGYLRSIAICDAIDLTRKIARERLREYFPDRPVWPPEDDIEVIIEVIKKCIGTIREKKYRIIMDTDLQLFKENHDWPTPEELTDEFNKQHPDNPLTVAAVKTRRRRGRIILARLLKNLFLVKFFARNNVSKKERTIASDEQETQLDSRNELFAAFEKLILPPIDDSVSPEDAMNALTKADRDAMAKMGDSSELVSNIIENARLQKHQSEQAETPTIAMKRGETETTPMERLGNGENEDDFAKLLSDQAKFESVHEVTWNTRFSIMRELGRGGQGVVYLIKYADEMSGQQALKIFSANPFEDVKDYRKEMRRMASVASVVNSIHHDNLLDVEHFFDHSGSYVMMMRLIDGYDLRYLLRSETVERLQDQVDAERWSYFSNVIYGIGENGRWYLKPGVAVNIIGNCLRGLSALHANNIVHADIKPSNIMLGLYGGIKLIDIGSAFSLDVKPKRQTWTPMYAPPEFFQRREWTRQSDLASLGYVLIELLTGQPAVTVPGVGFESTRSGIARDEDALLQAKLDLPDRLDEILSNDVRQSGQLMTLLRRLIDPDPRQRFDNAVEAIEQGTYLFHKQLVQGDLEVDRPTEIQRWIEDAKRVKC